MTARDWLDWHSGYADPGSDLSRRVRIVRGRISDWFDEQPEDRPLQIISLCAGQGEDLFDVLPSSRRSVRARLIEFDPRNVAVAQERASSLNLHTVDVRQADAGWTDNYLGAVPADLVLVCGVFGNVSDADVEKTVRAMPQLCGAGGSVIWTRSRREPDPTRQIRRWFAEAAFAEQSFDAPDDAVFSVGVHRLIGPAEQLRLGRRLFRFV